MTTGVKDRKEQGPLLNEKIVVERLQLIDADGRNLGIIARGDALRAARLAGLDLVLISESGREGVPVAKIMDFGKVMYERKKQSADAKKHHKEIQVKELKIRPKIGDHDFDTKMTQGITFLKDGKRLKVTLVFRGREAAMRDERGGELFGRIQTLLENEFGKAVMSDKDLKTPQMWSKTYYLKK
jgi:translation initiation factor IF-3